MQIANVTLNSAFSPTYSTKSRWVAVWNNLIDSTTRTPLVTFPDAQFGTNTNVPQESIQRKWQFKDDLSKTVGNHTFKTGLTTSIHRLWVAFLSSIRHWRSTHRRP